MHGIEDLYRLPFFGYSNSQGAPCNEHGQVISYKQFKTKGSMLPEEALRTLWVNPKVKLEGNPVYILDIDNVDMNNIPLVVKEVVSALDSYTEISRSGRGLHVIFTTDRDMVPTNRKFRRKGVSFEFFRDSACIITGDAIKNYEHIKYLYNELDIIPEIAPTLEPGEDDLGLVHYLISNTLPAFIPPACLKPIKNFKIPEPKPLDPEVYLEGLMEELPSYDHMPLLYDDYNCWFAMIGHIKHWTADNPELGMKFVERYSRLSKRYSDNYDDSSAKKSYRGANAKFHYRQALKDLNLHPDLLKFNTGTGDPLELQYIAVLYEAYRRDDWSLVPFYIETMLLNGEDLDRLDAIQIKLTWKTLMPLGYDLPACAYAMPKNTILKEFVIQTLESTPYPNIAMAIGLGLSLMHFLAPKGLACDEGINNFFVLIHGETGSGKTMSIRFLREVLSALNINHYLETETPSSKQGFYNLLVKNEESAFFVMDEIANFFRSTASGGVQHSNLEITKLIKELFSKSPVTESASIASLKRSKESGINRINRPHMALVALLTTPQFTELLDSEHAVDGLFNRCLVIDQAEGELGFRQPKEFYLEQNAKDFVAHYFHNSAEFMDGHYSFPSTYYNPIWEQQRFICPLQGRSILLNKRIVALNQAKQIELHNKDIVYATHPLLYKRQSDHMRKIASLLHYYSSVDVPIMHPVHHDHVVDAYAFVRWFSTGLHKLTKKHFKITDSAYGRTERIFRESKLADNLVNDVGLLQYEVLKAYCKGELVHTINELLEISRTVDNMRILMHKDSANHFIYYTENNESNTDTYCSGLATRGYELIK